MNMFILLSLEVNDGTDYIIYLVGYCIPFVSRRSLRFVATVSRYILYRRLYKKDQEVIVPARAGHGCDR